MAFTIKGKRFYEWHPICYKISVLKENLRKDIRDFKNKPPFATSFSDELLPNVVSSNKSELIKVGPGIDPVLQENKAINIDICSKKMDRIIIKPGEVFSFWKLVGKISEKNGFKDGRVINSDRVEAGLGGGLCNLANSINLLILNSPMKITELFTHSDALAPDKGKRVPFSAGTSIAYKSQDYRFKNTTDQDVQLVLWCADGYSYAELRSEKAYEHDYRLAEDDHHFRKVGDKFYRFSKIYKETVNRETGEVLERELILDNKSEVFFDYSLIPADLIKN